MTRTYMIRKTFLAGLAALLLCSSANAAVIVGLLLNPASTAGVTQSTRSGPGSWQLYAIEDAAATDPGIWSYIITMAGATAIDHRSPYGSEVNRDGDVQAWGFASLRNNGNQLIGAQPLA